MYLISNVLDESKPSDQLAATLYGLRWGVEVYYRSIKRTSARPKMRSDAPVQAALELRWSIIGFLLLGLMAVKGLIDKGAAPQTLSFAEAPRCVRTAIRSPWNRSCGRQSLLRRPAHAQKDFYERRRSKADRHWPHPKKESPPGEPKSPSLNRRKSCKHGN